MQIINIHSCSVDSWQSIWLEKLGPPCMCVFKVYRRMCVREVYSSRLIRIFVVQLVLCFFVWLRLRGINTKLELIEMLKSLKILQ